MTIASGLLLRLCALAFAMSSSAATPQTSSSLLDKMDVWCAAEVAYRLWTTRNGFDGSGDIHKATALQRRSFNELCYKEKGSQVGCKEAPYNSTWYYYLRAVGTGPAKPRISLGHWCKLCLASYNYLYNETKFSEVHLKYLKAYDMGEEVNFMDTDGLRARLLALERCGALVLPVSQVRSVPMVHATEVVCLPTTGGPVAVACASGVVIGSTEDTAPESSLHDDDESDVDDDGDVLVLSSDQTCVCAGIMHSRLAEYGMIDYRHSTLRFDCRRDGKWYSKECSVSSGKAHPRGGGKDVLSCPDCMKAYHSVTKKTCPLLYALVPSGKLLNILPEAGAVAQGIKLIVEEVEKSKDRKESGLNLVEALQSSNELKGFVALLKQVTTDWVGLVIDQVIVAPCRLASEWCATFVVASSVGYDRQSYTCAACYQNDVTNERRDARRESVVENSGDLSNRARNDQMAQSPDGERVLNKLAASRKTRLQQKRRIAALEAKLASESVAVKLDTDDPRDVGADDHMQVLASILEEFVLKNPESGAVLDKELTSHAPSADDRALFVEVTLSTIKNFVKQCEGKPTAVRYHPAVVRAAMGVASKSPAGYQKLITSGFSVTPGFGHLQRLSAPFKGKEGANKRVYEIILDLYKETKTLDVLHGILICDEITLRAGLAFNTRNHAVVGFAGDTDSFGKDLCTALSACASADATEEAAGTKEGGEGEVEEKKTTVPIGKKANVWMFRFGRNQRFHLEYFINDGNLDGAAILAQYNIVVMNLRNVGCKVSGIMCDAGGGNQGWYRLLRRNKLIPDDAIISIGDGLVYAIHPVDPESPPSMMHCASHIIKSLRNQLYASRKDGARSFTDKHCQKILWEFFEELLEISRQTFDFGHTRMNNAFVHNMDKSWAKMNVSYAKRMFAMETVNFAIKTFVEKFNAKLKDQFPDAREDDLLKFWTPTDIADMFRRRSSGEGDESSGEGDESSGEGDAAYLPVDVEELKVMPTTNPQARGSDWLLGLDWARVRLLRRDVQVIEDGSGFSLEDHPDLGAWLGTCEVIAVIGELFNELLLHKEERITLANHEAVTKFLDDRLEFFAEWLTAATARQTEKGRKNWRLEFLSKETWRHLKLLVSGFLAYSKNVLTADKSLRYVPMLFSNSSILEASFSAMRGLRRDTAEGLRKLQHGCDYMVDSSNDLKASGYDENDVGTSKTVTFPDPKRLKRKNKIRQQRQDQWIEWASARLLSFTLCMIGQQTRSVNGANKKLGDGIYKLLQRDLGCHYSQLIANDLRFVERVRLSCGTEFHGAFDFLLGMDDEENACFDDFCQLITWRTAFAIEDVIKKGAHSCFELATMELMHDANVMESQFPIIPAKHPFVRAVVMEWIVTHTRNVYLGQFEVEQTATVGPDELSCYDVQRVMGWALKDLLDRYKSDESTRLSDFLRFLRVLHADVKDDEHYCTSFYGDLFRGLNRGGMAMLSATIFPWAKQSLEFICSILTYDRVKGKKSGALDGMWQLVRGKDDLYDMFLKETASYRESVTEPISDSEARTVVVEWLSKAFHVRAKQVFQALKEIVDAQSTVQFRSYLKSVCGRKAKGVEGSTKRERQGDESNDGSKRAKK